MSEINRYSVTIRPKSKTLPFDIGQNRKVV